MQSKKKSFIEAVVNTATGFILSLIIQVVLYPAMGIPVRFEQNLLITSIFTLASIGRGYFVRRLFNTLKPK
jgi:hypothetical protein